MTHLIIAAAHFLILAAGFALLVRACREVEVEKMPARVADVEAWEPTVVWIPSQSRTTP
jgi:hypothetical protein